MDNQQKQAINIEDEMRRSYLDYAMSVIIGRALPDVRDGLKPVHRRILYAMNQEGLLSNRAYSKSAGVVGEARVVVYRRPGERAENLFSASAASTLGADAAAAPLRDAVAESSFLYWWPGAASASALLEPARRLVPPAP